jgi:NAD(P)-dependent dehydrogenase (short-subunit alcohol dehydrogenase family)
MTYFPILKGCVALVTGAGQGNGRAIARGLARAGAHVIATDINADNAATTAQSIRDEGGLAESHFLDITDVSGCAALASALENGPGRLDVLVNNAGILIRGPLEGPDAAAQARQVMKVNYEGTLNVTQVFLPALRASCGAIVNVASVAAFAGWPNAVGYAPSKGAIKQLTQSLAAEIAKDGVRVNAIAPGVIATDMSASTRADATKLDRFLTRIPMGRVGEPDELVGAVLFLASSMSTYVTGITVPVDGGYLAA